MFCGKTVPDAKAAQQYMGSGTAVDRHHTCTLCSHGNEHEGGTNIIRHSNDPVPSEFDDRSSADDKARCNIVDAVQLAEKIAAQLRGELVVFYIRTEQLQELNTALETIKSLADQGFGGDPPAADAAPDGEEDDDEGGDNAALAVAANAAAPADSAGGGDGGEQADAGVAANHNTRLQIYRNNQNKLVQSIKTADAVTHSLGAQSPNRQRAGIGGRLAGAGQILAKAKAAFAGFSARFKRDCAPLATGPVSKVDLATCSRTVLIQEPEFNTAVSTALDHLYVDKKRKLTTRIGPRVDSYLSRQANELHGILQNVKDATDPNMRGEQRQPRRQDATQAGAAPTVEWSNLLQRLGQPNGIPAGQAAKLELAAPMLEKLTTLLASDDPVTYQDLKDLSKDPFLKWMAPSDRAAIKAVIEGIGNGRHGCSVVPETAPYSPCTLHLKVNWISRVLISMLFAIADMSDVKLAECRPDAARQSTWLTLQDLLERQGIYITKKNIYARRQDGHRPSYRIKQMHGADLSSRILRVLAEPALLNLFSRGDKVRHDGSQCPDLRTKIDYAITFAEAMLWTTAAVKPCRFFASIPDHEGCELQTQIPPNKPTAIANAQADLLATFTEFAGLAMDMLVPAWMSRKGCKGWQSTSAHLLLAHIPRRYREYGGWSLPAAYSAESLHQVLKRCYMKSGRAGDARNTRHTNVQHAHMCSVLQTEEDLRNRAFLKSKEDSEKADQRGEQEQGELAVTKAWYYAEKLRRCRDDGTELEVSAHVDVALGKTVFRTTTIPGGCGSMRRDLNMRFKERPGASAFDKEGDAKLSYCVEYFDARTENEGADPAGGEGHGDGAGEEEGEADDVECYYNLFHDFMDSSAAPAGGGEADEEEDDIAYDDDDDDDDDGHAVEDPPHQNGEGNEARHYVDV